MTSKAGLVARTGADAGEKEPLLAELRQKLAEASDGRLRAEEIEPAADLVDYGYIDSLSAVMLLAHVEQRYGVRIEDLELLETLTTLDAIAERILGQR